MNFLFIHQNFPGQYVRGAEMDRVRKIEYTPTKPAARPHLYVRDLEAGVINGQAVASICDTLKRDGFVPDLMVGHNGWGETLYLKDVWPQVPLLGYFEFYYRAAGADVAFDPEFPGAPD